MIYVRHQPARFSITESSKDRQHNRMHGLWIYSSMTIHKTLSIFKADNYNSQIPLLLLVLVFARMVMRTNTVSTHDHTSDSVQTNYNWSTENQWCHLLDKFSYE